MPEDARPDQPQSEWTNQGQSSRGSARPSGPEGRSECRDDWRFVNRPPIAGQLLHIGIPIAARPPITAGPIIIGVMVGRPRLCRAASSSRP